MLHICLQGIWSIGPHNSLDVFIHTSPATCQWWSVSMMKVNGPRNIPCSMPAFISTQSDIMLLIGNMMSDWVEMNAGMLQGMFLGPLTFIMLTDGLRTSCTTDKFVDDITMTEIIVKSNQSHAQEYCDDVAQQSEEALMFISGHETTVLLIGTIVKNPPSLLSFCGVTVDWVTTFKLLGVCVSSDLKWTQHVDAIVSKAASRLHFLKQLKQGGTLTRDLVHFYTAIVRPVLEYACPVWQQAWLEHNLIHWNQYRSVLLGWYLILIMNCRWYLLGLICCMNHSFQIMW